MTLPKSSTVFLKYWQSSSLYISIFSTKLYPKIAANYFFKHSYDTGEQSACWSNNATRMLLNPALCSKEISKYFATQKELASKVNFWRLLESPGSCRRMWPRLHPILNKAISKHKTHLKFNNPTMKAHLKFNNHSWKIRFSGNVWRVAEFLVRSDAYYNQITAVSPWNQCALSQPQIKTNLPCLHPRERFRCGGFSSHLHQAHWTDHSNLLHWCGFPASKPSKG